jgi:hypothetical protein
MSTDFTSGFLLSVLAGILGLLVRWVMQKRGLTLSNLLRPLLPSINLAEKNPLVSFQIFSGYAVGIFVLLIFTILMISKTAEPNAVLPVFAFVTAILMARS